MTPKTLVISCTDVRIADIVKEYCDEKYSDYILESYAGGIAAYSCPKWKEYTNRKIMNLDQQGFEKILIFIHPCCGYYKLYHQVEPNLNIVAQNDHARFLVDLLSKNFTDIEIEIKEIKQISETIVQIDDRFYHYHNCSDAKHVLVYPVTFWRESFEYMYQNYPDEKFDRYSYYPDNTHPANLARVAKNLIFGIKNISIEHHKSSNIICVIDSDTNHDYTDSFVNNLLVNEFDNSFTIQKIETKKLLNKEFSIA